MSHRCIKCKTDEGPTASGYLPGPIVDGVPTPIPSVWCSICKTPVVDMSSEPSEQIRQIGLVAKQVAAPIIALGQSFNVLRAARERVRELKRNLRQAKAWQSEHDQLVRLIKASKPATVRALKVAR